MTLAPDYELIAPQRNITFSSRNIIPDVSVVGYYPYDEINLLTQESVDSMATEAAELFVATMTLLSRPETSFAILNLGRVIIQSFSSQSHETQFTLHDRSTLNSLTMIYHRDTHELGQRSFAKDGHPRPYNRDFTVSMKKVILHESAAFPTEF